MGIRTEERKDGRRGRGIRMGIKIRIRVGLRLVMGRGMYIFFYANMFVRKQRLKGSDVNGGRTFFRATEMPCSYANAQPSPE